MYTYIRTRSTSARNAPSKTDRPTDNIVDVGTIDEALNITISSSGQTFRLVGLPKEALSTFKEGTVYVENGILKITGY